MTHETLLEERRRSGHGRRRMRDERRRLDVRAETVFTTNGGVATFTGASTVPTNSLLLPGSHSGLPTTQTRSSSRTSIGGASNTMTPTLSSNSLSPSQPSSSTTSDTPSPTATPSAARSTTNHKLVLAGTIAGFVALVIVIGGVVLFFIRRARRKRSEEVARQSFVAGNLLNSSKGSGAAKPKEIIPMGEAILFKGHDRKKGSRADDWKGLGSRDDRFDPTMDAANDAASMRSGGHRSPYTAPYQLSLGALPPSVPEGDNEHVSSAAVPPYTLTGAFAKALSAEDDEEREQSASNQSHRMVAGSPRIERGPQMRVAQTHPHPYADPSVLSSAVTTHRVPPYLSSSNQSSPTRVGHEEQSQTAWGSSGVEVTEPAQNDSEQPANFLSFTPSSAPLSDQPLHAPNGRQDYFGNAAASSDGRTLNVVPPSPSSMYSQQSGAQALVGSINAPAKPDPVFSPTSRVGLTAPSPSISMYSTASHAPSYVGLQARPSTKPTKQERATNMRALGDLIAALDGPSLTPSTLSPGDTTSSGHGGRLMPDAGLWRAALGSSPTLGNRQVSDSSAPGRQR